MSEHPPEPPNHDLQRAGLRGSVLADNCVYASLTVLRRMTEFGGDALYQVQLGIMVGLRSG